MGPAPGGTFQDFWSYKPGAETALLTAVKPTRIDCCVCCQCCMREMTLLEGNLGNKPEGGTCCCFDSDAYGKMCSWFEGKKPVDTNANKVLGVAQQPKFAGGCWPQVNIYSARTPEGPTGDPWAYVNGT